MMGLELLTRLCWRFTSGAALIRLTVAVSASSGQCTTSASAADTTGTALIGWVARTGNVSGAIFLGDVHQNWGSTAGIPSNGS